MISLAKKNRQLPKTPNGVVGINFRNRFLVDCLNQRSLISIANDKVLTKSYLDKNNISTPAVISVISRHIEIEESYEKLVNFRQPFVMKPAKSRKGRGVVLYESATEEGVTQINGEFEDKEAFFFLLQQILQGEYSFGRPMDGVLLEEKIETDKSWIMDDLPGAPDLRIVLIEGEPILAMARLPTTHSDGRANLHCGAVGVGIDLETHRTIGGIYEEKLVDAHPDTRELLEGHAVPDFERCLELSRKCYEAVPLNLMGIDLMRDINRGPVVIEINARPGLAIQVANMKGLLSNE